VRAFARYVRSLNPRLPRAVWLLQAGGLANMFGNGVVVPFLVIYLHNVRGISLGLAGTIAATNGLAALVSGPTPETQEELTHLLRSHARLHDPELAARLVRASR